MNDTIRTPRVLERRIFGTEFRDVKGSNGRQKWATAVTYDVVDDYGTIWLPSCFNQGLDERMPTILYGHDWYTLDHVLGQGIDYKDVPDGCDVLFEFADPELVPPAARAIALTSGPNPVLKDVSVGFDRQEWIRKSDLTPAQLEQGAEEAMVRAVMDELSIVVRGAVPGAQMRSRSWVVDGTVVTEPPKGHEPAASRDGARTVNISDQMVDLDVVVDLAKRKAAGDLSFDEAKATLELLGDTARAAPAGVPSEDPELRSLDELLRSDTPDQAEWRRQMVRLEARFANLFSNDQRVMLRDALNDRFQTDADQYIWVVDFTDSQVIFEMSGFDDSGYFMLPYALEGGGVVLDPGDPISVNPKTTYVPDTTDTAGQLAAAAGEQRDDGPSDADIEAALERSKRTR